MPAILPCSPDQLKGILIEKGWRVYNESPRNWSLVKGIGTESIEIPKRGRMVSLPVLYSALSKAEIPPGEYFELLKDLLPPQIKSDTATSD
jgi:hypothetical protein